MIVITAVIRPSILNKVTSALEAMEGFPGMTVTDLAHLQRLSGIPTRFEPVTLI